MHYKAFVTYSDLMGLYPNTVQKLREGNVKENPLAALWSLLHLTSIDVGKIALSTDLVETYA